MVDAASGDTKFKNLKTYGRDLVEIAGDLDPVIGRDKEIQRVIMILSQRNTSNPVLTGEPGVEMTAVVEGVAQKIVRGDVLDNLLDVTLIALDMKALEAGARFSDIKGRFESVLKEVEDAQGRVILFIDEIHLVLGAGYSFRSIFAADLLKPALARGQLRCIGATTPKNYHRYVEKDAAIGRRFQQVDITEPSVTETISILRGLKEKYEAHHHVKILDSALVVAAQLSSKFISGCCLPDKAFDLVDKACANVTVQLNNPPEEIDTLERKMSQLPLKRKKTKQVKLVWLRFTRSLMT